MYSSFPLFRTHCIRINDFVLLHNLPQHFLRMPAQRKPWYLLEGKNSIAFVAFFPTVSVSLKAMGKKHRVFRDKVPKAKHTDSTRLKAAISSGFFDTLISFLQSFWLEQKQKGHFFGVWL